MTKQITQGLGGITLAVLAAVAGLLLLSSTALATGTVGGDTVTVAAGAPATVTIKGNAGTGGIVNVIIDVTVDGTKLGTPTCVEGPNFVCAVLSGGVVRFTGGTGSASGLTGDVTIGTVGVTAGSALAAGQCSDLVVDASEFNDQLGAPLGPAETNGKVCVQAAATASPTAAPTTAAALPSTGGSPVDGNPTSASGMLTWLLVAAGLVVVSGGAWAVSRARREI